MIEVVFTASAFVLAATPLALYLVNVRLYRRPPLVQGPDRPLRAVSVLIPARDEERSIDQAVESVLASEHVDFEVIVLDDHSVDETRSIVERIATRDPRVKLRLASALPTGWCGKQHACWSLAQHARHPTLVFLDADVRVSPTGIARAVDYLEAQAVDLASGVPAQRTGSFLEKLLLPLIHFLLLGFLPIGRMRKSSHTAYAAGCGQLFVARRSSYKRAGGHAAIRRSLHDGLTLPAAFRRAGQRTDLFDATDVASCRMYLGACEVWNGLLKNAVEGLAHPKRIVPATVLLLGGQVMPPLLLATLLLSGFAANSSTTGTIAVSLAALGSLAAYLPRLDACKRFSQSWMGALLHPLGVSLFLLMQWYALARHVCGRPMRWKGRAYGEDESRGANGHVLQE